MKTPDKISRGLFAIFAAVALWTSCPALAQTTSAGLPGEVLPAGVGVNIHFVTGGAHDLDMIAAAGIKFIRMDMFWHNIEKVRGVYDWSAYDTLVSELDQRGIRALFILNLNDTLYASDIKSAITDSVDSAAYCHFAAAAAKRYEKDHCIWEIWNEPNSKNTWHPYLGAGTDAQQYAPVAIGACKAILAVDSNATIIAPALAGTGTSPFLQTIFEAGMLNYLNGVSVHAYRDGPPPKVPETVGSDWRNIAAMIAQYSPSDKNIPVISGEWGYATGTSASAVSYQTQADYFTRMNLFNLYSGVPLTIWYDWKNDGTDLSQKGQNRGLVTSSLVPKPSYVAAAILTHQLAGYSINSRYATGNTSDFFLVLKNSGDSVKAAAWTQGSPHSVTIPLSGLSFPDTTKDIWWVDDAGDTGTIPIGAGSFTDELTGDPKYYSPFPPAQLSVAVPVPSVPVLLSPAASELNVLREPALNWNSAVSYFPIKYHIQIATDSTVDSNGAFMMRNVVFDTTIVDTSLTLSSPLDSSWTYYWHISAVDIGGASSYSQTLSFKTGPVIALPFVPALNSPPLQETGVAREATLTWDASQYAAEYELQVATDFKSYASGDSADMFLAQNVVLDSTLADTTVHLPVPLDSLTTYYWQVRAANEAGKSAFSATGKFTTGALLDAIKGVNSVPKVFELYQNYPNPFNPTTTIRYDVPKSTQVSIRVYDVLGRKLATLVDNKMSPGKYSVEFNGAGYASGVYFFRMTAGSYVSVQKMLLLK